jgi:nucleoside-diphosphate-sugar epimerase
MAKLIIGCGYLGKRVAELWHKQGQHVLATTRSPEHAAAFRLQGWEPIVCDVLDRASLQALPRAETVLYCVGFDRTAAASMREVYVDGLRNVLEVMPPPGRFIHVSSTSVYAQCEGEEVDENSPTEPEGESGRIVLEAESLVHAKMPQAVILRFAGIYGPGRWMRRRSIESGEPIDADPDRWLNLIHVADGASAVLAAEALAQPGAVYNVSDGHPVRLRDFYTTMAERLQAPAPRFAEPVRSVESSQPANRRISNGKMIRELRVDLAFPSYREALD